MASQPEFDPDANHKALQNTAIQPDLQPEFHPSEPENAANPADKCAEKQLQGGAKMPAVPHNAAI